MPCLKSEDKFYNPSASIIPKLEANSSKLAASPAIHPKLKPLIKIS
jgi:hypothetical protein